MNNRPHIMVAFGIDLLERLNKVQRKAIIRKEHLEWILFLNDLATDTFWWEMGPIKVMKKVNQRMEFDNDHYEELNGIKELILHMYTRHPEVPDRIKDKIVSLY